MADSSIFTSVVLPARRSLEAPLWFESTPIPPEPFVAFHLYYIPSWLLI